MKKQLTLTTAAAALMFGMAAPAFAQSETAPADAQTQTEMPNADGAMENAGEAMDNAAEGAANTMENAAEQTGEAMENAAEATKDMAAEAGAAMSGEKYLAYDEARYISAEKIDGATVYGPADEVVGDINEVIIARDGSVAGLVVGVGGFLGIGEKNVAVNFNQVQMNMDADNNLKLVVEANKEELEAAPAYQRGS